MMISEAAVRAAVQSREDSPFHRVPSEVIDRVVTLGTINTLKKGEAVFRVGDDAKWLYILIRGEVRIELHDVALRTMCVGDIGGLTSSIPVKENQVMKRSTTHVVASDEASLLVMSHDAYLSLLDHPDFAHSVVRHLQLKLRQKTNLISLLKGKRGDDDGKLHIAMYDTKPYDRRYFSAALTKYPKIEIHFIDAKLNEQTAALAAGCHAACIFVNDVCNAKTLVTLKAAGVGSVLLRCAGFNNVDLVTAAKLGIAVQRVPAYSPYAVAEHAFALLSTVNRRTARAYARLRDGNFALSGLEGRDLHGLTCGVVGVGKIGRCFVNIAKGCGMKVLVWDAFMDHKWAAAAGVEVVAQLKDLFPRSDVVSLHVPLTPQTKHLVNRELLASMPRGAIIINTSRGPIVDAAALLDSLVKGHTGGAGLDVYENEANFFFEDRSDQPIDDPVLARLVNMPNVVMTSHQAFLTDKALTAIAEVTTSNAEAYVAAGLPLDPANRTALVAKLPNVVLPEPAAKL